MKEAMTTLAAAAIAVLASCSGSGAAGAADQRDSAQAEEAVATQVENVYKYINAERQYYMETPPEQTEAGKWEKVDTRYGTKEWREVREQTEAIDRECECGGFFDFGDEGPLDAWRYNCFEGEVKPSDIKVRLLEDGSAQADFTIKDATSIEAVPLRWTLREEDGEWRVANIVFVKDDNMDLLKEMKEYVEENR